MPNVLVLSRHAAEYAGYLAEAGVAARCCQDLATALPFAAEAEILFGAPDLLAALLPRAAAVRWVQSSWAGIRPLLDGPRRGYQLTGVKAIFGASMTEYVLAWLLAVERRVADRHGARHWDSSTDGTLAGKTLGIMGTGSIGSAVANTCSALGLEVRGLNSDGREQPGFRDCWPREDRLAFAADIDYLVALLPDTPATDNLIDAALLDAMAPGAVLINAGRGNAIVMADLLAALKRGHLRQAVLDVLREEPLPDDDPLWNQQGLTITSHTAAPTPARAIVEIFLDNYRRYLAGEALLYPVDLERGY